MVRMCYQVRDVTLGSFEDETCTLSCKIRNQIPSDAASYPGRTDITVNALVLEEAVQVTVC